MCDVCTDCGSTEPHVTIGWPVCPNDGFHTAWVPRRWRWLTVLLGHKRGHIRVADL
jgi:hypothetical protein